MASLERQGAQAECPQSKIVRWEEIPDVSTLTAAPITWAVRDIIPAAAITLIAGEQASYKTWLALVLVRGVSSGGQFLGLPCVASDVLYLDRENPLAVVQERLATLDLQTGERLKVWGGWCSEQPPGIGDFRLLELARERKPLLIFDSFIRFHGADENSATEMAEVMGHLRQLANLGATVVALHHKPKAEGTRYRGSSDIAGGVDVALSITRDRQAGIVRLECFKSRYREEFSLTLRPEITERGDFTVTEAPEVSCFQADSDALRRVIESEPGLPQSEVVKRSGLREKRAHAILRREAGRLWRTEPGEHNSKRYFAVPEAVRIEI